MNPDTARNRFTELEGGDPVDHRRVEAFFDDCGPLDIDDIIGEWRGAPLRTGHKGVAQLDGLDWYGKVFRSRFDITPVACRGPSGRLTDPHGYGG
uniref:GXWXG domain-containing protein n=1 Tax=Streptomyces clavuligerus TaxID=1901 RepID=UPI0018D03F43